MLALHIQFPLHCHSIASELCGRSVFSCPIVAWVDSWRLRPVVSMGKTKHAAVPSKQHIKYIVRVRETDDFRSTWKWKETKHTGQTLGVKYIFNTPFLIFKEPPTSQQSQRKALPEQQMVSRELLHEPYHCLYQYR